MPSPRKSAAARANGAKSNGPVTPQGKARSSANAIKHGLNSKVVVLPHEDRPAFERLRQAYMDRFQPADPVEAGLVETMAAARWRLDRLIAVESKLYEKEIAVQFEQITKSFREIDDGGRLACAFDHLATQSKSLAMLARHEGQLNRTYDRAFKQLQILQKPKDPAPAIKLQNEPKPDPAPAPSRAHPAPQPSPAAPSPRPGAPRPPQAPARSPQAPPMP
jgi:hypothetical protein